MAHGKPAPDLLLHAAERIGVSPRHCVVVEDSLPGVAAAIAAGMTTIGFTGGAHCPPGHASRLIDAGAGLAVGTMAALMALLAR